MLDKISIDLFVLSFQNQSAVNNLWFRHQSLLPKDSMYEKKEKKVRTMIRTRVWRPSFMLNHSSDGLIGMLMRLARCLLDQFGLKDTTPVCQLRIREWRKSPIPVRCSPVAPDCAAAAQFNHRRSREHGQTLEEYVRTNTSPSHIIKSTFGPSGFYCARAELLNQWAKHQLFSYWTHLIHLSCYKLGHRCTWANTVIYGMRYR